MAGRWLCAFVAVYISGFLRHDLVLGLDNGLALTPPSTSVSERMSN